MLFNQCGIQVDKSCRHKFHCTFFCSLLSILNIIINVLFSPGKAYPPEFYYDTYSPLWQNRPRVYGFKLQWTQMNPNAVDRIVAYRLGIRQVGSRTVMFSV